ncbi:MAG: ABC transporter substrate-binding protein [Acidimicrobiia bacterium]|nr:ABC transporter substrate-binding protein [Acidimicrobiia bacterium]
MRRSLLLLVLTGLIATACAGDGPSDTASDATAPETSAAVTSTVAEATSIMAAVTSTAAATTATAVAEGFPVTVAGAEISDRPRAILSMSSTSTEILFAIGAGDQVVAVDSLSNYPPDAPITDLSAFEPNIEAIVAFEPDLVVLFSDPGDLADGLNGLGIPVITHIAPTTIEDAYAQIAELGVVTGNIDGAGAVVAEMRTTIKDLVSQYSAPRAPLTYYHEVDNTLYSATSQTFIGSIYGLFGLENIADRADADGTNFGFPQLSEEYIVEADPDIIFYGCAVWCGTNAETLAERPGWDQITAVSNGAMVELDDDIVSRWGPRLVEFVSLIEGSLAQLQNAAA